MALKRNAKADYDQHTRLLELTNTYRPSGEVAASIEFIAPSISGSVLNAGGLDLRSVVTGVSGWINHRGATAPTSIPVGCRPDAWATLRVKRGDPAHVRQR